MQSEIKLTKYLKAKDDSDSLQRALNNLNLIIQGLGDDYKSVVYLAEAFKLVILNLHTIPSIETLLRLFQREQDNINDETGEE